MNNTMARVIILACIVTVAVGLHVAAGTGEQEFVCEQRGALSERHVGVKSAWHTGGGMWRLRYVDGDGGARYYKQKNGETCAIEPTNGS